MTVNCYINRTQITQQELGQGIATSTEHKKHNKNYDRELLHQQNTKKNNKNYDRELLHQQNTNNTTRTWSGNCYINRTQKTQ